MSKLQNKSVQISRAQASAFNPLIQSDSRDTFACIDNALAYLETATLSDMELDETDKSGLYQQLNCIRMAISFEAQEVK